MHGFRCLFQALLAVLCGCFGGRRNSLMNHLATQRAIVYREVEIRQVVVCDRAPCPVGAVLWQGETDQTGRIDPPQALLREAVEVRVRGFEPRRGMPFERMLRKGFVLDLKARPVGEDPAPRRNTGYQRQADASVTVVDAASGAPVANRKVSLWEAEYCESPSPNCGPGEEIWSGQTDGSGIIGLSKRTVSLAFVVEVDGFAAVQAWDVRNALRNGRTELRLTAK